MITKTLNFFVLLLIIVFAYSCDRPECKNANPIFNQFAPDTREYKSELAKQMQTIGAANLRFWFDKKIERGGKEFIEIYIQGDGLCAKGELLVVDKSKLKELRNNGGYRGAELRGVEIKTVLDSTGTNFVLENIDSIID